MNSLARSFFTVTLLISSTAIAEETELDVNPDTVADLDEVELSGELQGQELEPPPWAALARFGMGTDSNINLGPTSSGASLLGSIGVYGEYLVSPNLRISALGSFEKNVPISVPGYTEAEIYLGYIKSLSGDFQLRVSNLIALSRERTVFADGTVLLDATTLQGVLKDGLAVLVARRIGDLDLEAGTQVNAESHDGKIESSSSLGADAVVGLRYSFRDRLSMRLRYSYEFSRTTGLSSRNLAGGVDASDRALVVGVHRVRLSTRVRLARWARAFVRYDFVNATDDFSGFLNSREHVAFAGWIAESRKFTFEGEAEIARRFFGDRIPTIDNPNKDTVYSLATRVDYWALAQRRMGFFAMYRLDRASASPTGLLFLRHIALAGLSYRFGATQ